MCIVWIPFQNQSHLMIPAKGVINFWYCYVVFPNYLKHDFGFISCQFCSFFLVRNHPLPQTRDLFYSTYQLIKICMGNGRGGGCVWWVHRFNTETSALKRPKFGTWKTLTKSDMTSTLNFSFIFSVIFLHKMWRVCCFMSFMAQWKPYHRFTSTNRQRSI